MRALAKRLLLQRSASDDFEKSFLARLAKGKLARYNSLSAWVSDVSNEILVTRGRPRVRERSQHVQRSRDLAKLDLAIPRRTPVAFQPHANDFPALCMAYIHALSDHPSARDAIFPPIFQGVLWDRTQGENVDVDSLSRDGASYCEVR